MRAKTRRRLLGVLEASGVFFLTLSLYLGFPGLTDGVLSHPFINWDDRVYILENPHIRGLTWEHFRFWWIRPHFGNYAPLHLASYAVDYTLWGGLVPSGFHLTDALLHAGSALSALLLFRRLIGPGIPSFLGALLFAFHPVQVESVAWASERKSTLSMFFLLPSLILFLRHRDRTPDGPRSGRPSAAYAGSIACFVLSLLAKGTGVVLPVLMGLHEWLLDPRPRRGGRYAELAPYFVLSTAIGLATIWAQHGARALHMDMDFGELFFTMVVVFRDYVRQIFLPTNLNHLYYPEILRSPLRMDFVASAAFLIVLGTVTYRWLTRAPRLAFWSLWFLVSLGPVSNVLPLTVLRADRYLYLPSLAFAGFVLEWLARSAEGGGRVRRLVAGAGVAAIALCLGALTLHRVPVWGDEERLWLDSLSKAPRSHVAHAKLGEVYSQRGEYVRAVEEFRKAVRLQPRYAQGFFNVGFIEARLGRLHEAREDLLKGLALKPEPPPWNAQERSAYGDAHFYVGVQEFAKRRYREAERRYRLALSYRPQFPEAAFNLGLALRGQQRNREAYAAFDRAAGMKPDFYEAYREAAIVALGGGASSAEAARHLREALSLRPSGPDARVLRQALDSLLPAENARERPDGGPAPP